MFILLSAVLGTECAHYGTRAPHLAFAQGFKLLFKLLSIIGLGVGVDGTLGLTACLHALIKVSDNGLDGIMERAHPVEGATLCGG